MDMGLVKSLVQKASGKSEVVECFLFMVKDKDGTEHVYINPLVVRVRMGKQETYIVTPRQ